MLRTIFFKEFVLIFSSKKWLYIYTAIQKVFVKCIFISHSLIYIVLAEENFKKKMSFKEKFNICLAYVAHRLPKSLDKKGQPIRSSRLAKYRKHIDRYLLLLLNRRLSSPIEI